MLQLRSISLTQFKNYVQRSFSFRSGIIGISGRNGVGKTNLLDAIYYLCFTKSYFGRADGQHVHHGMSGFRIEGELQQGANMHQVVCILRDTGRKEIMVDDQPYDRFARHVGKFPCVIICPDDVRIITEGSEERRRFFDTILSQLSADYLNSLINYNRILSQRNSYLKSLVDSRSADSGLLDVYDAQMVSEGDFIYESRRNFLREAIDVVQDYYVRISGSRETIELHYESPLSTGHFAELLKAARQKDILLQRTTTGVHKDDLQIVLLGQSFKNIASQGQRKSLLFALKLAEFDIIRKNKAFPPLLLLDDVFEKLDETRMFNLLEHVCTGNEGQIFITDTHRERIADHMMKLGVDYQPLEL